MRPKLIALLTDFGHEDSFVGVMKGTILSLAPQVSLVDLCHEIPPQDIRSAAFELLTAYPFFPTGTLFLVVVDPGVGTTRRLVLVETTRYLFLGPDNGVLSWALGKEKPVQIYAVQNRTLFRKPTHSTFHGRDILAPVAGHLARGLSLSQVGPCVKSLHVRLPFPKPKAGRGGLKGEVLRIDHFGNLISNINEKALKENKTTKTWEARIGSHAVREMGSAFGSVKLGEAVAYWDSTGFLAVAIRNGSAAKRWGVSVGQPFAVHWR